MLNAEDKQFILQAISSSINGAIHGLKVDLDGRFLKIDERFAKIDERFAKIDERFAKIDERLDRLEETINLNGVMLENLQGVVYSIAEGVSVLNGRMDRVEKDVIEIKENIVDLPVIRKMVQRHDRQLAQSSR